MNQAQAETLSQCIVDWRHRGLLDEATSTRLLARYGRPVTLVQSILHVLALLGVLTLGMGAGGLIGMVSGSFGVALVLVGSAAVVCWLIGAGLLKDEHKRFALSGMAMVTVGLILVLSFLILLGLSEDKAQFSPVMPLFLTALVSLATAYGLFVRWPMVLGLLCGFHAVGFFHGYEGHGAYFLEIYSPRIMALVAMAVAFGGVVHERLETRVLARWTGYGRLFVIFGLLYFNLSLWMISIRPGPDAVGVSGFWVGVFTAACLAQIVAGARLFDGKFIGFGVVFLSLDLFTRFFEHFWDSLSKGVFFIVAGLIGLSIGAACEWAASRFTPAAPANEAQPRGTLPEEAQPEETQK